MEIKKYNYIVWIIGIVLSLVASFIGMVCSKTTEQLFMCLLPLVYILSVTLSGAFLKFVDSSSPGLMLINGLYFVKCVVYPFVSVISGTTYNPGNNDTIYAIVLELGEIVVIYMVYFLYSLYSRYNDRKSGVCVKFSSMQNHLNNGRFITFCFLMAVCVIIIVSPSSLSGYNFFTVESLEIIYEGISEADTSGVVALSIKVARYVLTAYLIGYCYRKYEQTKMMRYIVLAVVIVGATMMIVRGVSRSDFAIPGACGYFLLIRIFPKKKKMITVSILGCLVIVFVTFSLMRYSENVSLSDFSNTLQSYFCCEKNMANAIAARRIYSDEINFDTLLSDLFGNWAVVGKMFRDNINISEYFNFTYYGHAYSVDQIVPTIGQAYMQFGIFGTYSYTIIMVIACLVLDKKYRQSDKIDFSYLYLYGTVKCAVTLMGNLKIFSATVFNVLFPMLVLSWLNSKMAIKEKRI